MGKVTHATKLQIINLHRAGYRVSAIVKSINAKGHSVTRQQVMYWVKQYILGYFIPQVPKTWEKKTEFRKVTARDIEVVQKSLSVNPEQSSKDIHIELSKDGASLSLSTVKRVIHASGFNNATPRYGQMVRDANKLKRVEFCSNLISSDDTMADIIFTDESSVQLHHNKRTSYRKIGQTNPILPKPKHPLKLHVWGGISRRGQTKIVIFEGIMESEFFTVAILKDAALPFIRHRYPDGHRFQQDNDPKHKSKLAREFMSANGINHWNIWPSESPDLNPIEMVWAHMKREVAKDQPTNKEELTNTITKFWYKTLNTELCNRYIDHVFKVAPVCVAMQGKPTGDIPNKLFPESSKGRSFLYFGQKMECADIKDKLKSL